MPNQESGTCNETNCHCDSTLLCQFQDYLQRNSVIPELFEYVLRFGRATVSKQSDSTSSKTEYHYLMLLLCQIASHCHQVPCAYRVLVCQIARVAERSKALRSGRSLLLKAWVRIPPLATTYVLAGFLLIRWVA